MAESSLTEEGRKMWMDIAWASFGLGCVTWIIFWTSFLARRDDPDVALLVPLISGIVSVGLTVAWVWIWRSFFHGFVFSIFFTNPGLWLGWAALIAGTVLFVTAMFYGLVRAGVEKDGARGASGVNAVLLLFVGFISWTAIYASLNNGWEKSAMYDSLVYSELSAPARTTNVRYLPRPVAYTYAYNKLQEPAIELSSRAMPVVSDGEFAWQVVRKPKGFWNKQLDNSDGFGVVDSSGNVSWTRDEMKYGEGMYASDSLMWRLHEKRYWSKIEEIYYIAGEGGEVTAIAPYLDYYFKFPVMVPRFGGVLIAHSNGEIEDVRAENISEHPILAGIRVVPKGLARRYVEAYKTKDGLGNYYFRHHEQVVVADSGYNFYWGEEMPYLLPTESGQEWFVAGVPWGAKGSYKFFYIDAISGEIAVYNAGADTGFLGPRKALNYVRTNYPQLDIKGGVAVLEPRPIFRGEEFYWMYTLTTKDYAGVVDTVLVEARTSKMLSCGTEQKVLEKFLVGENACRVITIHDTFYTLPQRHSEGKE